MDWDKVKGEFEGLSEAQVRLVLQLVYGWLSADQQLLLVKLAGAMGAGQ